MNLTTGEKVKKRLIVLISDCLASNTDLAHKIYWMAVRENLSVLYLYQVKDDGSDLAVSRCMATMKAVTSANRLQVEIKQIHSDQWREAVDDVANPGDYVVWQDMQTNIDGFYRSIPVNDFLANHLRLLDQANSDFYSTKPAHPKKHINTFLRILGYLLIITFFTWVEIELDSVLQGSLQKILVMSAICLEFGAIWAWFKFEYGRNW